MIGPRLADELIAINVSQFYGVPDSVLARFTRQIDLSAVATNSVCANEGVAVGNAVGHYLGTGQPAAVYMQNSGLGNAVNPLVSLSSGDVSAIPIILIIGWRGEPGSLDEPQHIHQGRITVELLRLLQIPIAVATHVDDVRAVVQRQVSTALSAMRPAAILVQHTSTEKYTVDGIEAPPSGLTRYRAITRIVDLAPARSAFVATTGFASRELSEVLDERQMGDRAFLVVGAMGHASQVSYGLSSSTTGRHIVCIDGDGALLMHLGGLTSMQRILNRPHVHIVINNGCHESVGGQLTSDPSLRLADVARVLGHPKTYQCSTEETLDNCLKEAYSSSEASFVEVIVSKGSAKHLSRPKKSPADMSREFRNFLSISI